jgi:hypothetical protein
VLAHVKFAALRELISLRRLTQSFPWAAMRIGPSGRGADRGIRTMILARAAMFLDPLAPGVAQAVAIS